VPFNISRLNRSYRLNDNLTVTDFGVSFEGLNTVVIIALWIILLYYAISPFSFRSSNHCIQLCTLNPFVTARVALRNSVSRSFRRSTYSFVLWSHFAQKISQYRCYPSPVRRYDTIAGECQVQYDAMMPQMNKTFVDYFVIYIRDVQHNAVYCS